MVPTRRFSSGWPRTSTMHFGLSAVRTPSSSPREAPSTMARVGSRAGRYRFSASSSSWLPMRRKMSATEATRPSTSTRLSSSRMRRQVWRIALIAARKLWLAQITVEMRTRRYSSVGVA
jgi:hypothetical protein